MTAQELKESLREDIGRICEWNRAQLTPDASPEKINMVLNNISRIWSCSFVRELYSPDKEALFEDSKP
jgi:hypothetical protein